MATDSTSPNEYVADDARNEILVGVNETAASERAVRWATHEAAACGGGLYIVHVVDAHVFGASSGWLSSELRRMFRPVVDNAVAIAGETDATVHVRTTGRLQDFQQVGDGTPPGQRRWYTGRRAAQSEHHLRMVGPVHERLHPYAERLHVGSLAERAGRQSVHLCVNHQSHHRLAGLQQIQAGVWTPAVHDLLSHHD